MKAIDVFTKVYLGVMFSVFGYAIVFMAYKLITNSVGSF